MIEKKFLIDRADNERLDLFLKSRLLSFTRTQIQRAIEEGEILVNKQLSKPGYKLRRGDLIEVRIWKQPESQLKPEMVKLEVLYEDAQILIINKPDGLVVHPGAGIRTGTLVHGLLYYYPEIASVGSPDRPGIVHRLDKDTSGLLIIARTQPAYQSLRQQFEDRRVKKIYLALAVGKFKEKKGLIDLPLGRHLRHREKISVSTRKPRIALTHYEVLEEFKNSSFLALNPITGRTHQLRVHLSATGHPIVGDRRYGRSNKRHPVGCPRLFLHAWRLSFQHPASGQEVEFESPLPADLLAWLKKERSRKN
ncbi:MAG: RluA family pseudouridine synthase [Acidobacteriota bacterium]|nr:RluA family pseudouridine synthase [Acidobacteriota bacterium]MDW3228547.1 RluA family pseudouridine synthase [Acidobacteriota bacterium]MDY0231697.1 RluA family pseudouridine synthase [Candidatus Saccharicenans sp.]